MPFCTVLYCAVLSHTVPYRTGVYCTIHSSSRQFCSVVRVSLDCLLGVLSPHAHQTCFVLHAQRDLLACCQCTSMRLSSVCRAGIHSRSTALADSGNCNSFVQVFAAGSSVVHEEPSLYQSPLSHQSVSSFGSPSPRPAAPTPTQVTPNTSQMDQQPPDGRNALLTSIAKGQFHLRKMSHSFEPKGSFFSHTTVHLSSGMSLYSVSTALSAVQITFCYSNWLIKLATQIRQGRASSTA